MIGTALRRTAGGPPAPTLVGSYSDGANASTHVLNVPTGTIDGDLMITACGQASFMVLTPPAGWTLLTVLQPGPSLAIYYRFASSEPASYTWTTTGNSRGEVATYRGASGIDTYSITSGNSNTPTATGVTTSVPNTRLLYIIRFDGATSWTPAAGFTVDIQSPTSGNTPNAMWGATQAAAGATGNVTFTAGSSSTHVVALVALKP